MHSPFPLHFIHSLLNSIISFSFITRHPSAYFFFFFNDTAPPEISTLPLHDALPICRWPGPPDTLLLPCHLQSPCRPLPLRRQSAMVARSALGAHLRRYPTLNQYHQSAPEDRKSTRLNSSHSQISYAVFCLKKKKTND